MHLANVHWLPIPLISHMFASNSTAKLFWDNCLHCKVGWSDIEGHLTFNKVLSPVLCSKGPAAGEEENVETSFLYFRKDFPPDPTK